MAELSKVFTGMEKGPEKIQANFDAINKGLLDTGWVKLSVSNATGNVFGRRIGNTVYISGTVQMTKDATPSSSMDFLTIPANFVFNDNNSGTTRRYRFFSAFSSTTDIRLRFQMSTDGTKMFAIFAKNALNDYAIDFGWEVN